MKSPVSRQCLDISKLYICSACVCACDTWIKRQVGVFYELNRELHANCRLATTHGVFRLGRRGGGDVGGGRLGRRPIPLASRRCRHCPDNSRSRRVGARRGELGRRGTHRRVVDRAVGGASTVSGDGDRGDGRLDRLTQRHAAVANDQLFARQSVARHRSLWARWAPAFTADEERVFRLRFDCNLFHHIHQGRI